MTAVLTLVQTKQIRINIHKRNNTKNTVQTTQNTVNTSTHITKTSTQLSKHPHTHTHTLQNKLKQPQYKIHTKWNSHITIKYTQFKVTLMYCTWYFCPQELHRNSLHFKTKSLHKNKIISSVTNIRSLPIALYPDWDFCLSAVSLANCNMLRFFFIVAPCIL